MFTSDPQPHEIVWTLTSAVVASRSLHVIADLGVADQIDREPVGVEELAAACDVDPDGLDRVLRLLAAFGIFEWSAEGYRHTEASQLLRSDHPRSMRAFARMMGLPAFRATFGHLEHSVVTGSPAMGAVEDGGLWPYLQAHPREAEIFGQAMTAKAAADIAAVLGAYDFARFHTIADIGGGRASPTCSSERTADGARHPLRPPRRDRGARPRHGTADRPVGRLLRRPAADRRRLPPNGGDT